MANFHASNQVRPVSIENAYKLLSIDGVGVETRPVSTTVGAACMPPLRYWTSGITYGAFPCNCLQFGTPANRSSARMGRVNNVAEEPDLMLSRESRNPKWDKRFEAFKLPCGYLVFPRPVVAQIPFGG